MAEISKSKAKRLAQQQARYQKKKSHIGAVLAIIIPVAIIIAAVVFINYRNNNSGIYVKYFNNDGTFKNINIDDYCVSDFNSMIISRNDVENVSTLVEADIYQMLTDNTTIDDDPSRVIAYGDKLHVAYEATIDGAEYETYTESDPRLITMGYETLGSEADQLLIGSHVGSEITFDREYPEDWKKEELAGKTVHYELKVVGLYIIPAFDDAFVSEHLSDQASSAAEYRELLTKEYQDYKRDELIQAALNEYCTINSYPEDFMNRLIEDAKANDLRNLDSLNQMYGANATLYDVYGIAEDPDPAASYEVLVRQSAEGTMIKILQNAALAKELGITVTKNEVKDYFISNGTDEKTFNSYVKTYGWGYLATNLIQVRVDDYIKENIKYSDSETGSTSENAAPEATSEVTE